MTFEGGHRVPFIVHWPATIKQPVVSDVPINAMDLFPTLSQIIGVPLPSDRIYDGESLMPLITGEPLKRKVEQPFFITIAKICRPFGLGTGSSSCRAPSPNCHTGTGTRLSQSLPSGRTGNP